MKGTFTEKEYTTFRKWCKKKGFNKRVRLNMFGKHRKPKSLATLRASRNGCILIKRTYTKSLIRVPLNFLKPAKNRVKKPEDDYTGNQITSQNSSFMEEYGGIADV